MTAGVRVRCLRMLAALAGGDSRSHSKAESRQASRCDTSPKCPTGWLNGLAGDDEKVVRESVARSRQTSAETLRFLVALRDDNVGDIAVGRAVSGCWTEI